MVEPVACYGYEVWLLKTEEQRKLLALEMDYLRRSIYKEVQITKNPKHRHQEQNASRTISFRQKSKKAIEMVWTPP